MADGCHDDINFKDASPMTNPCAKSVGGLVKEGENERVEQMVLPGA